MKKEKIAIIGGGFTGLVAAKRLVDKGYRVTVFEKEKSLGGLNEIFEIENNNLEKVYHHIFKTDKDIIALIDELGLLDDLNWYKSSVAVYSKNNFYSFLGAMDLLKFPDLDFISKFRLGLIYLWLKFDNNWQRYEKIPASEWMEKWAGKNAYKVIWEPLMKGKFHDYSDKVSMAWLWARIHTRGGSTNEKGEEVLGYINGSFGKITDALAKEIKNKKSDIKLDSLVKSITERKDKKVNIKVGSKNYVFDRVLVTTPSEIFAKMIDGKKYKRYVDGLQKINYLGAMTLAFSSGQKLSNYYWHNINDLQSPFLVFVQHTNLVPKNNYSGKYIFLRIFFILENSSILQIHFFSISG
ncbi:FAD-binding protein [bacterium]|nr:FAD-binding protein [bacterium]